jgi:hypothetical protein
MACATPLLTEEGWPRPQEECREASFDGADGVVKNGTPSKERIPKRFGNHDHPVCAAAEASHLFLDGAATPPVSGGELPASHSATTQLIKRLSGADGLPLMLARSALHFDPQHHSNPSAIISV